MLSLINIALSWTYNKKTYALDSSRDSSGYLRVLAFVAVALLATACGSSSSSSTQSDSSLSGEMAQLTVTIPGLNQSKSKLASDGSIAHRDGVPAEVTSLIIDVLNSSSEVLNAVEVIGTDGTVSLTFAAGENYTLRGRAFAGDELLFLGQTALASVKAGSVTRVSLSLADQINLVLTAFGDIEIGIGATPTNFNLTGLKDLSISWYVNGVLGGNAEFGLIDTSGRYTPPAALPANPVITILAEPVRSPSFAQAFSFNLLPTDTTNNAPPNAVAGADQAINPAALVTLLATASNDTDGSVVTYSWTRVSGNITPVVANANTATASFTAPSLQYGGVVTYRLSVTDNEGASATDDITITVNGTDQPLAADAGVDQNVNEGMGLTLDGSGSSDADNSISNYQWIELSASGVVFDDANSVTPMFTAPAVSVDTLLQFRLTVTNDNGDQDADTVSITVKNQVAVIGDILFAANDDFNGYDLWTSDSTEAGTQEVLAVTLSNSDWWKYRTINDKLYFSGQQTATGRELWRSDGAAAGTELIQSAADAAYGSLGAAAGSNPAQFVALGDYLIYSAATSYDETFFYRDTLSFNTQTDTLITLVSGSGLDSGNGAENFAGVFNGYAYFSIVNFGPSKTTLYRTDGSNPVETILTINGDTRHSHDYIEFNGELYFGLDFDELWKTDGTPTGTTLVKSFSGHFATSSSYSGENNIVVFNNRLIFTADDGEGRELWVSDGTNAGTTLLLDLDSSPSSTNPTEYHLVNGRVVFQSSEGGSATDGLWVTDGTIAGSQRISTVEVAGDVFFFDGRGSAFAEVVDSLGLMFFAGLSAGEIDLWVTDGTAAGTQRVIDLNPGNSDFPAMLRAGNNELLFVAEDGDFRAKLWRSNGTAAGTTLVKDINPAGFGNSAFFMPGG